MASSRERERTAYLFQEMWQFNILTRKWNKVFTQNVETNRMPEELASNAVVMRGDMLVVSIKKMNALTNYL